MLHFRRSVGQPRLGGDCIGKRRTGNAFLVKSQAMKGELGEADEEKGREK